MTSWDTAHSPAISVLLFILLFSCSANSQVNELKPLQKISVGSPTEKQEFPQAIKFTSPPQGTTVSPGQTIHFSLYVNTKLQASLVGISPINRSDIEDINISRPPWQGSFVVPESGPELIKLRPFVIAIDGDGGLGPVLTLRVTPRKTHKQMERPVPITTNNSIKEAGVASLKPYPRKSSDGVRIIAPTPGSIVKPGDPVTIKLDAGLAREAEHLIVKQERLQWTGETEPQTFPGPPFEATIKVPEEFSGPVNLRCTLINKTYGSVGGANINIQVLPNESPVRLWVWPKVMVLSPPRPDGSHTSNLSETHIQVSGRYADNVSRRLEPSIMGTTYRSTDENVVVVNERGEARPIAPGMAQIIVANRDAEAAIEVIVKKTTDPDERTRLKIMIKTGQYHHDEDAGRTTQPISVINGSRRVRTNSVYLLVANLPSAVTLRNRDGISQKISPGTPYLDLTPEDGDFKPGDTVDSILQFDNPEAKKIDYRPRLIWGTEP